MNIILSEMNGNNGLMAFGNTGTQDEVDSESSAQDNFSLRWYDLLNEEFR